MKTPLSPQISQQASRFLKLAGLAIILIALLDLVLLPIPLKLGDVEWRLNLTTQLVERGVVPMLGMALIFSGYAFENLAGGPDTARPFWRNIKLWIFLISTFLGLLFLLLVPLHVTTVFLARNQTIARIEQDTKQAEQQLDTRLKQQETEISELLKDRQKLADFSRDDRYTQEQLARLQQFRTNPQALKAQTEAVRSRYQQEIQKQQQEAIERSKLGTLKSIIRIAVSSWLLASFYITIAWTGLRQGKRSQLLRRS